MTQMYEPPRRFAEVQADGDVEGVFYFHQAGDYLFGWLLCKESIQTAHYPFVTYKMKVIEARQDRHDLIVDEDQVIVFPGNVMLRRIIDGNELIGSLVKIVFKGKRGHAKNYDVFKEKGTFYSNQEQKHERSRKRAKSKRGTAGRTGSNAAGRAGRTAAV